MKISDNKLGGKRLHGPAIAAVALGALMSFQAGAARADDTATEIRLLKERLKQLEHRVAKQDRERKAAEAQIRRAAATAGPPIMAQTPNYSIPKIPGSSAPRPAVPPPSYGIGLPGAPPSYQTGGLTGLEAKLKGYPYIGPSSLFVNNVSITPGGFFELASVTRDHFIGADIATPWQNIPFANVPTTHTGEFRLSARRSRAALLVRGDVNPATRLSGYGEFDWLSAAQTANENQSDSFNLRIRHLYAAVDNDDFGAHFLAGHAFTLATMDTVGILPRKEDTPIVIEDQYVPGFVWARQDQIRVVKDFDQTLWFALSAEQPATTFGGVAPTVPTVINNLPGVISPPPGQGSIIGGSLFNSINPLSLNQMPDLIGKAAWDPTIGGRTIHMEAFGIFRNFVDRVILPGGGGFNHNNNSTGGGVGGSILVPIIPKMLEAQFSGLTGRGIGRYGAAQLPDVTFNPDGSLTPIQETMLLAGLIWHAMPGLDFYSYAGEEYENPKFGFTPLGTVHFVGWGSPFFNNSGCEIELSTICSGNVKLVRQITGGFWDDIYKGPWGRLTGGLQYSFTQKYGFEGLGFSPKRNENMFFTSLRYYPF
ncbi:MAG: hypothetical protein ACREDT_00290 [Methylocella sp.]